MIERASTPSQPRAGDTYQTAPRVRLYTDLLAWSLAILLAALPFETVYGLRLPGLLITHTELLAVVALGLWGAALLRERRLPMVEPWLAVSVGLFAGLLLLSALLAAEHRGESVKFALRQAQGCALALCLAERARAEGWRLTRWLLVALAVGGLTSAALGLYELSGSQTAMRALGPFKIQPSMMSGLLRMSATFAYANIAGMYYESLLPVALAASLGLLRGRWRLLGVGAAALLFVAVILTYSRAALAGAFALALAVPLLAFRRWGRGVIAWQSVGLAAGLGALAALVLLGSPVLRLRLSAADVATWYDAEYRPATLAPIPAGEVRSVAVLITNTGEATWPIDGPRPVMLAYHWLDAESGAMLVFDGRRTRLPRPLEPGDSLELQARVLAPPQPGRYLLEWDLLRENGGGWFSQNGTPTARVPVTVQRATAGQPQPPLTPQVVEPDPPSPDRSVLWAAAVRMWRESPWLGIGPDVFRHVYGPWIGLERWDDRIHTNNLYLEILTGSGIIGFAAFLALLAMLVWKATRGLVGLARLAMPATDWWCLLASALGLAAFLVHGVLDVFLGFTATYLLFWAWVGITAGLAPRREFSVPPATCQLPTVESS